MCDSSSSEGMRERGDAKTGWAGEGNASEFERGENWAVCAGDQSSSSSTARGAVLGVGARGRACIACTGVRGDGGGAKLGKRRR